MVKRNVMVVLAAALLTAPVMAAPAAPTVDTQQCVYQNVIPATGNDAPSVIYPKKPCF